MPVPAFKAADSPVVNTVFSFVDREASRPTNNATGEKISSLPNLAYCQFLKVVSVKKEWEYEVVSIDSYWYRTVAQYISFYFNLAIF